MVWTKLLLQKQLMCPTGDAGQDSSRESPVSSLATASSMLMGVETTAEDLSEKLATTLAP